MEETHEPKKHSEKEEIEDGLSSKTEAPHLPEFTFKNVCNDIINGVIALFMDPFCNAIVVPILVVFTSIACKIVIANVKYTEIDFKTYMQQIDMINDGELDYSLIAGDTGPIVYPAGFVQIYQWLSWLSSGGEDIPVVQSVFGYLHTLTVLLTCCTYSLVGDVQPWAYMLIVASKRLMSIYVLRLFNDCFTTACMVGVTLVLQAASYWFDTLGSTLVFLLTLVAADLYSMAISIKMNALLFMPAFLIVVYFLCMENILKLLAVILVMVLVQVMVGWKFLLVLFHDEDANYLRMTYLQRAFDFKRSFLYEWTVNWRFVPEEYFTSKLFANFLLVCHISVLIFFVISRFFSSKITGKSLVTLVKDGFKPFNTIASTNLYVNKKQGPKLILLTFATTNTIGVLLSRSLHYQFLSWYCWHMPFLLYSTGWGPIISGAMWAVHEWCWLTFPSTIQSSAILVTILSFTLATVWHRGENWYGS
ncbi:hypothetical protein PGUG_03506 [Meyerozyma guilliermondii ATCC 6260]|uniref:Dol-P-Man:Man(5)GlcNAc(2)-PP-Dol alpha-1,3-mannosyltransferase n=1 Tax=Meyerozyma guilliermondii (strain ATCC 6260 / CBS 566 / DSM 6381 / JCM 1539 / NBRC 10279 / NRRL Y-324) TaxID=294746 RepID=ALG3_PICGU|nr:uncharacterized protein PGUG_03506 [Meyerozyma guilliermondii ATCC 6260]A5DJQ5.2 RecName: Full=Dol-P-Man:Man(5)GlcNAc(2)-PP-Dol alpha-1,3-mannosyltransferase; AltName: Full=Asparagine-linked glycosylation protein 6; AltName: Full=Dol-P-Man-dependent alpha(1-3)-mannosyltransferase; AltName: Full=Dolichyl-P-Man:Man(5)GlcNAc(2)-PP-dolichyl mannosyltransferase [Meyerozyma guilliermondii ATCC 6260]EDK39408.2 hypothetical protein PGUG_03506 [Meyerozyma guilliermondii ATCC 6260]